MYNYVLYSVRQGIFSGNYLKEYEFSTKLGRENQFDFRNMPTDLSQQVVGQVFKSIRSWVKLKKDFDKNPSKYGNHRPHIPSYKKGKKQNMVVFTTNSCRIKDGYIHFVKNIIHPIKTKIGDSKLCQVRIIPQATCYVIEVIYEKKEQELNLNKDNVLSIDLGLNKGWKQEINLGKKTNQKFVEIPFSRLIDKISYKCKLVGISFQINEESYTSKVDHLAFEKLGKHDVYLGKRKKRGLFQSSIGKLLNADINGAIGIGRKVFGDFYVSKIIDSGFAFNPVRVSIL